MSGSTSGETNHHRLHQSNVLKLAYLKEEIELRWEEQDLELLIEALPIGICITDEQGYFFSVNSAYSRLYGYPREELLGRHFTMVVPENMQQQLADSHDRFIEREFELKDIWQVRSKSGQLIEILANAALLELEGRRFKMTFVVDITDQRETERRLSGSIRQLSDELRSLEDAQRMVYHDVRNSIGNIAQMSEMISEDMLDEEEKAHYLRMIRNLSIRTLSFLDMLLSLRRMENGEFELDPRPMDLRAVLEDCRQTVAARLRKKQIPLHISVDNQAFSEISTIPLRGDDSLIIHAIDNLLQNAIEASPKGQPINIAVECYDKRICIRFRNQGVVPAEIRSKFFDKYTTAGKSNGSGLGTYIARLVTESHQGNISMNTSEENGTEIIMCLPREPSLRAMTAG
jgi:PAS domain S-box-containing protein